MSIIRRFWYYVCVRVSFYVLLYMSNIYIHTWYGSKNKKNLKSTYQKQCHCRGSCPWADKVLQTGRDQSDRNSQRCRVAGTGLVDQSSHTLPDTGQHTVPVSYQRHTLDPLHPLLTYNIMFIRYINFLNHFSQSELDGEWGMTTLFCCCVRFAKWFCFEFFCFAVYTYQ